jgi:hypothetical protein
MATGSAHAPRAPAPGLAARPEAGRRPGGSRPSPLGLGSAGQAFRGICLSRARGAGGDSSDCEGYVAPGVGIQEAEDKQGCVIGAEGL